MYFPSCWKLLKVDGGCDCECEAPDDNDGGDDQDNDQPPSNWQPNKEYKAGDMVTFGGNKYKAKIANTSEPSETPAKRSDLWQII